MVWFSIHYNLPHLAGHVICGILNSSIKCIVHYYYDIDIILKTLLRITILCYTPSYKTSYYQYHMWSQCLYNTIQYNRQSTVQHAENEGWQKLLPATPTYLRSPQGQQHWVPFVYLTCTSMARLRSSCTFASLPFRSRPAATCSRRNSRCLRFTSAFSSSTSCSNVRPCVVMPTRTHVGSYARARTHICTRTHDHVHVCARTQSHTCVHYRKYPYVYKSISTALVSYKFIVALEYKLSPFSNKHAYMYACIHLHNNNLDEYYYEVLWSPPGSHLPRNPQQQHTSLRMRTSRSVSTPHLSNHHAKLQHQNQIA